MSGGINMPTSLARGDTRIPMTSSIGLVRTFGPDGHVGSNGLELRTAGSHWKKPIDSDQGGADDPPKKTPKDAKTSESGGSGTGDYYPPRPHPHYGHGPVETAAALTPRSPAAGAPAAADPPRINP